MLSRRISITAWGADPSGINDSTAAINTAFASGFAGIDFPSEIYFPAGTYTVSGTLITPPAGTSLIGVPRRSMIMTTQASGDVLPINNSSITIDGLSFSSSVPRGSGAYVHIGGGDITLRNFYMVGAYIAFQVDDETALTNVYNGYILNSVGAGQGVVVYGSGVAAGPYAAYFGNTLMNSTTPTHTNVLLQNVSDLTMNYVQALSATYGLRIAPGSGQGANLHAVNCFFDHGGTNFFAAPTGTGFFGRSVFAGCWFGSGSENGVMLTAASPATIDDVRFIGCDMVLSGGSGLAMVGNVLNVKCEGSLIAGNVDGIFDSRVAGGNGTIVTGNTIGAGAGIGGNSGVGIGLAGGGDYAIYKDNCVLGNGTAITNINTGTHNRICDNAGINPVGPSMPAVGASPWTFTNGPTPAVIVITGGSVSEIAVNGANVPEGSTYIGPNAIVVVTYTVAPTVSVITQ